MDNTKKLGLILTGVILVIVIIIGIYFTTYLFNIKTNQPEITTKRDNSFDKYADYKSLDGSLERNIQNSLTNNLIISFNNAFNNNFNLKNINLFETEESKFKYIYTYLKLNNLEEDINYEIINIYSNKIFNTNLYEQNLNKYLVEEYYKYDIDYEEVNYCLYPVLIKDNNLILDMIETKDLICENSVIDYDTSGIKHKVLVKYKMIDDKYFYNYFTIIK